MGNGRILKDNRQGRTLSAILILLSFCTYPVILGVPPEQHMAWRGQYATDIFMYFRAILLILGAILLFPTARKITLAEFGYVALLFISVYLSPFKETTLFGTPNYYEGAIVIVAYLVILGQRRFPEKAVMAAVFIVTLLAIIEKFCGCYLNFPPIYKLMPVNVGFETRSSITRSSLGNPNYLGLFCALLFPYFLAKKRWVTSGALLTLLLASESRGAWIAVLVTSAIQLRKSWRTAAIASAIFVTAAFHGISDGFSNIHWPPQGRDMHGRVFIWSETIPMLRGHWLAGSGPGVYSLKFPQFSKKSLEAGLGMSVVDRPHNLFLNIWYSTGFLSLLLCLLLILKFFKQTKDQAKRMGVLGFLIAGLFTDSVVSVTPYFMAMLGSGLIKE